MTEVSKLACHIQIYLRKKKIKGEMTVKIRQNTKEYQHLPQM